jgi:hypothetical protein
MKKYFSIFVLLIFSLSKGNSQEATSRFSKSVGNEMILDYSSMLKDSLETPALTIPTNVVWEKDRNDFVSMIEAFIFKNESIRKKSSNSYTGFTIAGTVVGVGGGIYGLFSNSEPKGAAFTSLIVGALTGLLGTLNLQKKTERAFACSDYLQGIIMDFKIYWGVARCPGTQDELKTYLKAKDQIIASLKNMKCYGLVDH